MRRATSIIAGVVLLSAIGCVNVLPPGNDDLDTELREILTTNNIQAAEDPTVEQAKVTLGQALFFDKILSGNQNISCSTCHLPEQGTGDGLSLSFGQGGIGRGPDRAGPTDDDDNVIFIPRNAPPIFNRPDLTVMFWDGRVADNGDGTFVTPAGEDLLDGLENLLAAQAMFPVTSRDEMRGEPGDNEVGDVDNSDFVGIWNALIARVLAIDEYVDLFAEAFPDIATDDLTFAHAANAIAAFEIDRWTLTDAPFDDYLRGDDDALSASAKRGALLFYGDARCSTCHAGSEMTDERFHNVAIPAVGPGKGDGEDGTWDFGRGRETGNVNDRFTFKTPSLRHVADTGPWMHNGAITTLEAAVRHMLDPVGSAMSYDPSLLIEELQPLYRAEQMDDIVATVSPVIVAPVELSDGEVADLVAFLESLSSPSIPNLPEVDRPESVPSGLPMDD